MRAYERLLEYVKFDTQSDSSSSSFPSTAKQKVFGKYLVQELESLGLSAEMDENGYVYSMLDSSPGAEDKPGFALIAHMDTATDMTGKDVKARIIRYTGGDIVLNEEKGIVTKSVLFPEMEKNAGEDLIITDGTTLLGADDKAGIAEIMTYVENAVKDHSLLHPRIQIIFTPDEEIGRGVDRIDMSRVVVPVGYTVDGGEAGIFQYETFNASSVKVTINGVTAHTGYAKGRIINSNLICMEFHSMLPVYETPFCTENREGFYHLSTISGTVEKTTAEYSLRDHDINKLRARESLMRDAASFLNMKYGKDTVLLEFKDMYMNMGEEVLKHKYLVDYAVKAIEEEGITPVIEPVRGGTDGSRLSFMGLPCPNLPTGCHNGHGRHEYVSIQSMDKCVGIISRIAGYFYQV